MERLIVIILLVVLGMLSKKKQRKAAAVKRTPPRAAAPAPKPSPSAPLPVQQEQHDLLQAEQTKDSEQWQGSIPYTPEPAHVHEGKAEAPCPAQQRIQPRVAMQPDTPRAMPGNATPAISLDFANSSSVLQGVVMSEVLRRPEFVNGRRVIR